MLTREQIDFYRENGYLKCEALFTPEETAELGSENGSHHRKLGQ